ncbi:hypothetical protein KAR91_58365 [Candidatus Pacearchaeota archaeon]|nr:hypothetical protein [Candidatus Pacearchaeota archaeon]
MLLGINMNKSGVSGMVGYVLLIGIVMSIGTFLYVFLQSYVPQEEILCSDGAAISILSYECEMVGVNDYRLSLTLKNSGRFNLAGYNIYATNDTNQIVATMDLSSLLIANDRTKWSQGQEIFYYGLKDIETSESFDQIFENIPDEIFSVDITPIMEIVDDKKKIHTVSCGNAKIKERLECS